MSRPRPKRRLVDRSISIEELEQIQQKLRPVEDVQAPVLADKAELDRVLPMPKPKLKFHNREDRGQLRDELDDLDDLGCSCTGSTPCLAHWSLRRRRSRV